MAIYENEFYEVIVGKSMQQPASGVTCYIVINKETGVSEVESSVRVSACKMADDLAQEWEDFTGDSFENITEEIKSILN